jgi:NAD-dependent deacetylase
MHNTTLIKRAGALLQQSRHAIALTGAGISTPSGIPDFRSPRSGLWETADPTEVASIYAFRQRPQQFYDWIHPLTQLVLQAQPNEAHRALAWLEAYGPLKGVITQNIDMLHTRAGSQTVYEVHGHLREATCVACHHVYQTDDILPDFVKTGKMPLCEGCGHVLKPNVILFGEVLPMHVLRQAQLQTHICDLMLVAGSSLEVAPAGDLPLVAKETGASLIIVNLERTHLDDIADVVIHADVVDVLPKLADYFMPRGFGFEG